MKLAVYGVGAIGGVVGVGLAAAGEDVLLVDVVPEHVVAMNRAGLWIQSTESEQRMAVRAALPEAVADPFDLVFLAVKPRHTSAALESIAAHLGPDAAVVSLQNGLNEEVIARHDGV